MKRLIQPAALIAALSLSLLPAGVLAKPVTGLVANSGNYSLVHPMPTTSSAEWWRFDDGQTIDFDYANGIITTGATQTFSLYNGADTGSLVITDLLFDLNGANGFASGHIDYVFNGTMSGTFSFIERTYGNSVFNSSTLENGVVSVYGWGGDASTELGIDFALTGTVPEPGTLALFGLGLLGLIARDRRKV